eukprot:3717289-Ditylum_brightwellii.AAC.1
MAHDPYTLYIALDKKLHATNSLYMDNKHTFDHECQGIYATASFDMEVDYDANHSMSFICNVVEFGLGLASDGSSIVTSVDKSMEPSSCMTEQIVVMGTPLSPSMVVMDIN